MCCHRLRSFDRFSSEFSAAVSELARIKNIVDEKRAEFETTSNAPAPLPADGMPDQGELFAAAYEYAFWAGKSQRADEILQGYVLGQENDDSENFAGLADILSALDSNTALKQEAEHFARECVQNQDPTRFQREEKPRTAARSSNIRSFKSVVFGYL